MSQIKVTMDKYANTNFTLAKTPQREREREREDKVLKFGKKQGLAFQNWAKGGN